MVVLVKAAESASKMTWEGFFIEKAKYCRWAECNWSSSVACAGVKKMPLHSRVETLFGKTSMIVLGSRWQKPIYRWSSWWHLLMAAMSLSHSKGQQSSIKTCSDGRLVRKHRVDSLWPDKSSHFRHGPLRRTRKASNSGVVRSCVESGIANRSKHCFFESTMFRTSLFMVIGYPKSKSLHKYKFLEITACRVLFVRFTFWSSSSNDKCLSILTRISSGRLDILKLQW